MTTARLRMVPASRATLALAFASTALLAIGAAVHIVANIPLHRYGPEADAVLTGMQAIDILHGARPVFFAGLRVGALGSYLTAGLFALLGPSRTALALYPITLGILTNVFAFLFWRETLDRRTAVLALVFIVCPSPSFLFWTYMPNGYPPIFMLCSAILWLAARLVRTGPQDRLGALAFGLTAGLAWWQSLQTLICVCPATIWVLSQRRGALRNRQLAGLILAGFLVGASPWLGFNIAQPLASFHVYGVRPAASLASVVENAHYFAWHSIREFAAPLAENRTGVLTDMAGGLLPWLRPIVLLVYGAAVSFFVVSQRPTARSKGDPTCTSPWLLVVGVLLTAAVLNVFSEAGQFRGVTVRYLLPAYLVLPGILATFCGFVARRSRALAALSAAAVVAFNLASYHWPGRPSRQAWARDLGNDRRLLSELNARRISVVVGDYWLVYPINFSSAGRILGIPCSFDYFDYAARLPANTRREWALLASKDSELDAWSQRAGVSGQREELPPQYVVLMLSEAALPDENERAYLRRLVSTCPNQ